MITEFLISLFAYDKDITGYKLDLFRRIIIGGIIAPHGITDIFDKNFGELVLYYIILIFSILLDYALMYHIQIKLCILTFSSIYHMKNDIGKIMSWLLHILTIAILPENIGLDVFLVYMVLIHVPIHYYNHIRTRKELLIVLGFSLVCLIVSIHEQLFLDLTKYLPINGIIWGHIIFNELHII